MSVSTVEHDYAPPPQRTRFLTPSARAGLVLNPAFALGSRALSRLVPQPVSRPPFLPFRLFGLDASGAPFEGPGDITSVPPPHLYVALILQRLEHVVVANGGVGASWINWQGSGPQADQEKNGPFAWPLPAAGDIAVLPSGVHDLIYQGLELNGCVNPAVTFPISLESWIVEADAGNGLPGDNEIGRITVSDDDTIDRAGFYNFRYAIRAAASGGAISDFLVSGIVSVSCTNDTEL